MELDRIREKFLTSKKYLNKLKTIIAESHENLENNLDLQLISERIFEVLSQLFLDICTHIISNSSEDPPESYTDCMKKLGKIGVIQPKTTEKTISLIKMRNIIVHQYGDINYRLLLEGLRELDKDFPQFEKEILEWIESKENRIKSLKKTNNEH
ncbi:MAG: DUF86 domain-containing protein [Candidatus Odinarchaeota archaeon]